MMYKPMVVGIPLQIMYMGNVTPGGAVAWDLSYATYIEQLSNHVW